MSGYLHVDPIRTSSTVPSTTVLPIRGGQAHAPAAMLVRAALGARVEHATLVRCALAVVFSLADRARAEAHADRFWWKEPVRCGPGELAVETGFLANEVSEALQALRECGVLAELPGERVLLSPDVLLEQPLLASLPIAEVRDRLADIRASAAPAVAVLRELARACPEDRSNEPFVVSLAALQETTAYGRSTVSDALQQLDRAGVIVRGAATRQGVRVQLRIGSKERSPVPVVSQPGNPARPAGAAPLELRLPGGAVHYVDPRIPVRYELNAQGDLVVQVGPVSLGPFAIES